MSQLVVINLGKGDWQQGFSTVIAQLWEADSRTPIQFTGSLPAAPELPELYKRWQVLYQALYSSLGWRRQTFDDAFEIEEDDVTHVCEADFSDLCQRLQACINTWLNAEQFSKIDRKLRTRLSPADEIRLAIVAEDDNLLRLPWHLWHFFEDYPKAEIALSPPEYTRSMKSPPTDASGKVKILAILGNRQGIDLEKDQQLLEQLPNAQLQFLVEPNLKELHQQLWESGWDILFFAGHSCSQGKGQIQVNQSDRITIAQLKYGLRKAIEQGLKLAIFNSCDGLGLARDLADLYIPQVIVMREPVPDLVAQEFLKHFLLAFARGKSLYLSVREAREKLQALEGEFPCATWLPVICQNPAEVPPTWQEWCNRSSNGESLAWRGSSPSNVPVPGLPTPAETTREEEKRDRASKLDWRKLPSVLLKSVAIAGLIVGVRWLGILQPLELSAFDRLLGLRPPQGRDSRLLIVTIGEKDIQAQNDENRRGSLSDRSLDRLLDKLEDYQPRAIGLDIYRDFSVRPEYPELARRLRQNDRLIAVCKGRDAEHDAAGIPPPPEISPGRIGFSDFLDDADGVLRRQLLFMTPDPISPCSAPYAFSVQLAFQYLQAEGISPAFTSEGNLKLGDTVFHRLKHRSGGYQNIDARGNQILLNYRFYDSPETVAPQVSLNQVLSDRVNPNVVKDRLVLIGVTARSTSDYWTTPYGDMPSEQVPGILIQAQMVSQILSAVLDGRSLLWVWPQWGDALWIGGWGIVGGVLAWRWRSLKPLAWADGIALVALSGACYLFMTQGGWIPLVPSAIALVATSGAIAHSTSNRTDANFGLNRHG